MPRYIHDCSKCRFLGYTIGGGIVHDLYYCDTVLGTVVARYGSEGSEYYSCPVQYANPRGHAELWAAKCILEEEKVDVN